jgi:hypothetical protein
MLKAKKKAAKSVWKTCSRGHKYRVVVAHTAGKWIKPNLVEKL